VPLYLCCPKPNTLEPETGSLQSWRPLSIKNQHSIDLATKKMKSYQMLLVVFALFQSTGLVSSSAPDAVGEPRHLRQLSEENKAEIALLRRQLGEYEPMPMEG
jgi:hypothetical protein